MRQMDFFQKIDSQGKSFLALHESLDSIFDKIKLLNNF